MKTTRIALIGAVVVAALLPLGRAKACSCAYPYDARDRLTRSDGAFIGTLLTTTPDPDDEYSVVMTFEVDEAIKGELGDTVDIRTSSSGASCGIEASPGSTLGYFLRYGDGGWHSGLCEMIRPDELRAAAQPLPEPNGVGDPRFLVGGSFGDRRTMMLDFRTRTLAYGSGDGDVTNLDVCPRGKRIIELVHGQRDRTVAVRTVTDLTVEAEWPVPRRDSYWHSALGCTNRAARGALIFGTDQTSRKARGRIWRREADGWSVVYRGPATEAVMDGQVAYIVEDRGGKVLVEIRLRDGRRTRIVDLPGDVSFGLSVDRHGRYLSLGTSPFYDDPDGRSRLHSVRVADGKVHSRDLGRGVKWGSTAWAGDFRMVFFCESGDCRSGVFNRKLRRFGSFDQWSARGGVATRRFAYGVAYGELVSVRLPDGPIQVLQELPSPVTYVLARL